MTSKYLPRNIRTDCNIDLGKPKKSELYWQNFAPELRNAAKSRAHLVQLLKQVNPKLQVCRRQLGDAVTQPVSTLEKGVQVPDIRLDMYGNRKLRPRNPVAYSGFVEPGVRIQARNGIAQKYAGSWTSYNHIDSDCEPMSISPNRSTLRADAPPHVPRNLQNRASALDAKFVYKVSDKNKAATTQSSLKVSTEMNRTENNGDEFRESLETKESKNRDAAVVIAENYEKTKPTGTLSSGDDDDSVVVLLDEPEKGRELERKHGHFFCQRCLRGWISRSVWCVRSSCKVYIKQTCNSCNKVVNPHFISCFRL